MFVFLFLTYFTLCNRLWLHLPRSELCPPSLIPTETKSLCPSICTNVLRLTSLGHRLTSEPVTITIIDLDLTREFCWSHTDCRDLRGEGVDPEDTLGLLPEQREVEVREMNHIFPAL